MNKSDSIENLAKALAKAQAEISNPKKTSANPFFKSKYADLSEVINASKPVLSAHGLSVIQMPSFKDNMVSVETMLVHESGEYVNSEMSIPVQKLDAQSIGSVITYCRRYTLAAVCGLAQEDDDAEGAVGRGNNTPPRKPMNAVKISDKTFNQISDYIDKGDDLGLKQVWHEMSRPEQEVLWKMLNSQQQTVARDLLDKKVA